MNKQFAMLLGTTLLMTLTTGISLTGLPNLLSIETAMAQNATQNKLSLNLTAEKRITTQDTQGKTQVTWQSADRIKAATGDVLRYRLQGKNNSDRPVKNLVLTQPIPAGTTYVMDSAQNDQMIASSVVYSIDGGKEFIAKPTVQVRLANGTVEKRPAPDTAYTHVRWVNKGSIGAKQALQVSYQVKVR